MKKKENKSTKKIIAKLLKEQEKLKQEQAFLKEIMAINQKQLDKLKN